MMTSYDKDYKITRARSQDYKSQRKILNLLANSKSDLAAAFPNNIFLR